MIFAFDRDTRYPRQMTFTLQKRDETIVCMTYGRHICMKVYEVPTSLARRSPGGALPPCCTAAEAAETDNYNIMALLIANKRE